MKTVTERIEELEAALDKGGLNLPRERLGEIRKQVGELRKMIDSYPPENPVIKSLPQSTELQELESAINEAAKPVKVSEPRRGTVALGRGLRASVAKVGPRQSTISSDEKEIQSLRDIAAQRMKAIKKLIKSTGEARAAFESQLSDIAKRSSEKLNDCQENIRLLVYLQRAVDTAARVKTPTLLESKERAIVAKAEIEAESSVRADRGAEKLVEELFGDEETKEEMPVTEPQTSQSETSRDNASVQEAAEPSPVAEPENIEVKFDEIMDANDRKDKTTRDDKSEVIYKALMYYRESTTAKGRTDPRREANLESFRNKDLFYAHKPFDDLHAEIKAINQRPSPLSSSDQAELDNKIGQLDRMTSSLKARLASLKAEATNKESKLSESILQGPWALSTMLDAMTGVVDLEISKAQSVKALVQEKSAAASDEEKGQEVSAPAASEQIVEAPAPVVLKAAAETSEAKDTSEMPDELIIQRKSDAEKEQANAPPPIPPISAAVEAADEKVRAKSQTIQAEAGSQERVSKDASVSDMNEMPDVITIRAKSETEKEQAISALNNARQQISEGKVAEAITQLEGLQGWVKEQKTDSITLMYESVMGNLESASKIRNEVNRGQSLRTCSEQIKGFRELVSATAATVSTRPPAPALPPRPLTKAQLGNINEERMIAIMNTVREIAEKQGGVIERTSGSIRGPEGASYKVKIGDVTIRVQRTALATDSTLSDVLISFTPANAQATKQAEDIAKEAMPRIVQSMQQVKEKETDASLRQFAGPAIERIRTNLTGLPDSKIVLMKIDARNQLQELAEWKKNIHASDFTDTISHRYDGIVHNIQTFLARADKQLAPGIEAAKVELEQANVDHAEAKLEFKEAQLVKAFNRVGTAVKFQDNKAQIAQLSAAVKVITATDRYQDCKEQHKNQQFESDMRSVKAPPKSTSNATMKHSADEMKAFDAISKLDKLLDRAKAVKNIPIISNIVQGQIRQQLGKMNDASVTQGLQELGSKKVESPAQNIRASATRPK